MPATHPTLRKVANAFSPNAAIRHRDSVPGAATEAYRARHGGIWIGGTVEITPDALSFTPNRLNQAVHMNLPGIVIPRDQIRDARRTFGWLTGIVTVEHAEGTFRFRCFGARGVAALLAGGIGAQQPPSPTPSPTA
jgi:hypothetical protein